MEQTSSENHFDCERCKKNAAYVYGSINDRLDGAFSTEMVDSSSIRMGPNQRLKNMLFAGFRLTCGTKYGTMRSLHHVRYRQVAALVRDKKVPSLSSGQGNLVDKDVITSIRSAAV